MQILTARTVNCTETDVTYRSTTYERFIQTRKICKLASKNYHQQYKDMHLQSNMTTGMHALNQQIVNKIEATTKNQKSQMADKVCRHKQTLTGKLTDDVQ